LRYSDALNDDVFHKIFELLYRIVSKEKPVFLRSTTAERTRSLAASRLQVTAAAFRLTLEVGTPKLRFKTALSILDHIVDTLPLTDGSLCEPLKNDYIKSFRMLLNYPPHGEHMRPKQWQAYVDFALECLSSVLEHDVVEDGIPSSRNTSMASRHDRSLSIRPSQISSRSIGKEKATLAEEIVAALKSLTSVANARVMARGPAIAERIREYLNVAGTGQEDAFETLNNVMLVSLGQNVDFTQTLLCDLIPFMRRLWPSRSGTLREQMLITLFTCRYLFLAPPGPWTQIDADVLESLLTTLMSDYGKKDMLHFDDMQPLFASETTPLQISQFKPPRDSPRALSCWLTLEIISSLIVGLSRRGRLSSANRDSEDTPRKRRKVQNHLEEVIELAVVGTGQEKLAALQIVLFLFEQPGAPEQEWTRLLDKLLPDLNNEDPAIQTWVFLIFSRFAQESHRSSQASDIWLQVWDAARRAMAVVPTTRVSCHVLTVLLKSGVLHTAMTANLLDGTLFGGGSNGPSSLTDTSLVMMTTVLGSKFLDSERQFEALCLKVIGWLTLRWTLRMYHTVAI
jgi:ataxia telangiectasia mutated family protein